MAQEPGCRAFGRTRENSASNGPSGKSAACAGERGRDRVLSFAGGVLAEPGGLYVRGTCSEVGERVRPNCSVPLGRRRLATALCGASGQGTLTVCVIRVWEETAPEGEEPKDGDRGDLGSHHDA